MIRFWLRFAGLCMALWFALRVALALSLPDESVVGRLLALGYGFGSDLQALALLFGFLSAGFLIGRRFAVFWLGVTVIVVVLAFVGDALHWGEFQTRVGRLAVHYIVYVREVLSFIQEQVYLGYFLLPLAALAWWAARWMRNWLPEAFAGRHRLLFLGWMALGGLVLAFGQAAPTGPHRHLNQLASNDYLEILYAARLDLSEWEGMYWTPPASLRVSGKPNEWSELEGMYGPPPAGRKQPQAPPPRKRSAASAPEGTSVRRNAARATAGGAASAANGSSPSVPTGFQHLLLVIEESFGGDFWWQAEQRRKYMPELAAIAQRGRYFSHLYATGSRTIRGLEAILNGYPPLPGVALSQRRGFERLPSLPRALGDAGFHTVFVYGGWPNFTNFFGYWRGIGFKEMLSRYDFAEADRWYETSWGVADEILLERVLAEMDRLTREHERVMLATLTVTNHLPFDFPDGRIPYPSDERRPEYAVAYADWALGRFMEQVDQRPWLADTLVVVIADHGPDQPGAALVPANNFRVPMVLYNPERLAPERIDHHGSTLSVPLTLLEMLGVADSQGFYGASLTRTAEGRVPVEEDYHFGLLGRHRLTVLARGGGLYGWRYDGKDLWLDQPDLEQASQAAALFGEAHRRFYGP